METNQELTYDQINPDQPYNITSSNIPYVNWNLGMTKDKAKELALEAVVRITSARGIALDGKSIVKDAQVIYEWLIKE